MKAVIVFILSFGFFQAACQRSALNIYDFSKVRAYANKASICDLIRVARLYRTAMVQERGYSSMILKALLERGQSGVFILVGTNQQSLTLKQQVAAFTDQLEDLNRKQNCKTNPPVIIRNVEIKKH